MRGHDERAGRAFQVLGVPGDDPGGRGRGCGHDSESASRVGRCAESLCDAGGQLCAEKYKRS